MNHNILFNLRQGIDLKPIYTAEDTESLQIDQESGKFPYTRGPYATMYTHRPWTIRQVSPMHRLLIIAFLVCRI